MGNEKLLEMIEKKNILIINVSVIPLIINQLDKKKVERKERSFVTEQFSVPDGNSQFTPTQFISVIFQNIKKI